jgi:hypothetical protein
MTFIGLVLIIVLAYFLIIRPLTHRHQPPVYGPQRRVYTDPQDYYEPTFGRGGFSRFGTFAGGLATGALLTYLLEEGRIGYDQFMVMRNMEDHELLRELQEQNILQQDEINQLRQGMGGDYNPSSDLDWNADGDSGLDTNNVDFDPGWQQNDIEFGGWDGGSEDNWL